MRLWSLSRGYDHVRVIVSMRPQALLSPTVSRGPHAFWQLGWTCLCPQVGGSSLPLPMSSCTFGLALALV